MKQRNRKEISDLTMDLEVINPIESKTLLGGEWYDTPDPLNGGWLNNVNVGGGSSSGGGYDTWGEIVDYSSDWNNYGGDGSGGGSSYGGDGLPNLPSTVEQQLGSMGACVSYAMSFMSSYLGHVITGANMALHNAQVLQVPIMTTISTGLDLAQSTQAIQSYFQTTTLTNVNQIINAVEVAQHGVLANVYVYQNGAIVPELGHEVAIVDYDAASGLFYAADSNTGAYSTYTADQINMNAEIYEINGVKP